MDDVLRELHTRLGIKPVSLEECEAAFEDWERRTGSKRDYSKVFMPGIPLEEAAALCDGHCWPITERLTPMIAGELEGASTVLDVGVGTALRLAYYRKKAPGTSFYGIDRDPLAVTFARQRLGRLGLTDVVLAETSVQDLRPEDRRFSRVIMSEVSMLNDEDVFKAIRCALKLVDNNLGSKFIFTNYAVPGDRELSWNIAISSCAASEGLTFVKNECFKNDLPMGFLTVYGREGCR